jgi:hypothetical protein
MIPVTFGSAQLLSRVYYSSYHLWAANHFSMQAKQIEDQHIGRSKFDIQHRAFVTNAIFSSIAFLEAVANEFYKDVVDGDMSYVSTLDTNTLFQITPSYDKRMRTLEKFQKALKSAGKSEFDRGRRPYQDVALLIQLRNQLIHFEPKTVSAKINWHKFESGLKSRFVPNKLMNGSGNPYFPDHCLGYGCTEWAINSSKTFADTFFAQLGVVPNYQRVSFNL